MEMLGWSLWKAWTCCFSQGFSLLSMRMNQMSFTWACGRVASRLDAYPPCPISGTSTARAAMTKDKRFIAPKSFRGFACTQLVGSAVKRVPGIKPVARSSPPFTTSWAVCELAFHAAHDDTLDEVALRHEEERQAGQRADQPQRHQVVPVGQAR